MTDESPNSYLSFSREKVFRIEDRPRYDFDFATLSREKYFWNFWGQPISTKTFCGQAADVHVNIATSEL